MKDKEEKEVYEIDNRKYIVTTRVVENAQGLNNLYEAFSKYALRKLNITIWRKWADFSKNTGYNCISKYIKDVLF